MMTLDKQRPPWLARLSDSQGRVQGAGVLIDDDLVLTCAHVAAACIGDPALAWLGDAPISSVAMDFPFVGGSDAVGRIKHGAWFPIRPDGSGDVAVLQLEGQVPGTKPAPLRKPEAMADHAFSVHGFPRRAVHGPGTELDRAARAASGIMGPFTGESGQWVQLQVPPGRRPVDHGFSGAPVWDERIRGVVGICVMRDDFQTAHMLALSTISRLWGSLDRLARWRLDLAGPDSTRHWVPRARGVEPGVRSAQWLFSGRGRELSMLTSFLVKRDGPSIAVVTGGPGAGKSALLGYLLLASHGQMGREVPSLPGWDNRAALPPDVFDVAIRVDQLTVDDVRQELAGVAGIDPDEPSQFAFLAAMRERGRSFTALLDGIDEAKTPRDADAIAVLVAALARNGTDDRTRCRILCSVRSGPPGSRLAGIQEILGSTRLEIDLSDRDHRDEPAVVSYATRLLLGGLPLRRSPYHDMDTNDLAELAYSIAQQAESNFLITQLTCRWLSMREAPPARAGELVLPGTVADALDLYLNECELRTPGVRGLLRPLAFARGNGLPRSQLWVDLARAVARGHQYTLEDLTAVFDSAAAYLVDHGVHDDRAVYRLYHQALDEHLRAGVSGSPVDDAFARTLLRHVPVDVATRDWPKADPYIRAHIAEHAADAGLLDNLVVDAGFLVHGEPRAMLGGLDSVTAPNARLAAAVFRTSMHLHADADEPVRRLILAMDSARWGAADLVDQLNRLPMDDLFPWAVRQATGSMLSSCVTATITGVSDQVTATAVGDLDGSLITVIGEADGTVRIWDGRRGTQIGMPMVASTAGGGASQVGAIAVTDLDGIPVAVTGAEDGTIRIWNLRRQGQIGPPLIGCARQGGVNALAVGDLDGVPIVISGAADGTVRIWDLRRRIRVGQTMVCYMPSRPGISAPLPCGVVSITLGTLGGRPVAVSGSRDFGLRVWDLREGTQIGETLIAEPGEGIAVGPANALAFTEHQGTPMVVAAESGGSLRLWNLQTGRPSWTVGTADRDAVTGVIVTAIRSTQRIVIAGQNSARLQIWDFTGESDGVLIGHSAPVMSLASGYFKGRQLMASSSLDGTVLIWDPDKEVPAAGEAVHAYSVTAAAINDTDGLAALTGDGEGIVARWRESGSTLVPQTTMEHEKWVTGAAIQSLAGFRIGITSGLEGRAVIRGLDEHIDPGEDFLASRGISVEVAHIEPAGGSAMSLARGNTTWPFFIPWTGTDQATDRLLAICGAATTVAGKPIAVVGSGHGYVQFWDLPNRTLLTDPIRAHQEVSAVAVGQINGMPIAATGGWEGAIMLWDLTTWTPLGEPMIGHSWRVRALTMGELAGQPVALSADQRGTVVLWDLVRRAPLAAVTLPAEVRALALSGHGTLVVGMGAEVIFLEYRNTPLPEPVALTARLQEPMPVESLRAWSMHMFDATGMPEAARPVLDELRERARQQSVRPLSMAALPSDYTDAGADASSSIEEIWRIATDAGQSAAMHNLAVLYYADGDIGRAHQWAMAAAHAGEARTMFLLAAWYRDAGDDHASREWWVRAAEAGSPDAMLMLAEQAVREGNRNTAEQWTQRAAQSSSVDAVRMLGLLAEDEGRATDAYQWYLQAARRLDPDGMSSFARINYNLGRTEISREWWDRAARSGHIESMFYFGMLLHREDEPGKGDSWWDRAEQSDDVAELKEVAKLHERYGDPARARAIRTRLRTM
jgi:WD40 repeat protein/TPR repeat protein